MKQLKKYHYLAVKIGGKFSFVYKVQHSSHMCYWATLETMPDGTQPKNLGLRYAEEIATGLLCNGYNATIITSFNEILAPTKKEANQ